MMGVSRKDITPILGVSNSTTASDPTIFSDEDVRGLAAAVEAGNARNRPNGTQHLVESKEGVLVAKTLGLGKTKN